MQSQARVGMDTHTHTHTHTHIYQNKQSNLQVNFIFNTAEALHRPPIWKSKVSTLKTEHDPFFHVIDPGERCPVGIQPREYCMAFALIRKRFSYTLYNVLLGSHDVASFNTADRLSKQSVDQRHFPKQTHVMLTWVIDATTSTCA